ncbi:MAG: hypothetical protein KGM47_00035, partial [Acidobacteriota bacterium]|nr:hypothetical protein [Acidobacteriota bacterium]
MADFAPPEGPLHRFRSGARGLARISRARYWYPHAPLALALAFGGFLVLLIVFGPLWRTLLADFPSNLLRF